MILSVSQTDSSGTVKGSASGIPSSSIPCRACRRRYGAPQAIYEKYGFSARIATRHRSNYIGEIDDFSGSRALEYVTHEQITDLQTGYEFQQGPARRLSNSIKSEAAKIPSNSSFRPSSLRAAR